MQDFPEFDINLEKRPRLVSAGTSTHGQKAVERYRMLNHWCIHFYLYEAEIRLGDVWLPIRPGSCSVIPPRMDIEFRFRCTTSQHTYAHFALPEGTANARVWAMNTLPREFPRLLEAMQLVARVYPDAPLRAEVRLWDILWELADGKTTPEGLAESPHGAFVEACELIELRLESPQHIAGLAAEVGLSHNQLTRVFRRETGGTVIAYVHRRRAQRACHLLTDTTLPIKAIAHQVGVPDPQHFNKFIRRMLGASPSAIRDGQRPRIA